MRAFTLAAFASCILPALAQDSCQNKNCPTISTYKVISGDTLSCIAENNNVSLPQLLFVNRQITNRDRIKPGDVILIPGLPCVVPATTPTTPSTPGSCKTKAYTVKSGDTFTQIAQSNGIPLVLLESANHQVPDYDSIQPGDVVNIPCPGSCPPTSYTVVKDDTLFVIAQRFNITLDSVEEANLQIKNYDRIDIDQVINIPCRSDANAAPPTTPPPAEPACMPPYKVKLGDTFGAIAESLGIPQTALANVNPQIKDLTSISPGQAINIPCPCVASNNTPYSLETPSPLLRINMTFR